MKKSKETEVEMQITPMLDMAFQLLTFFIMTYHPAPSEVQFGMNLLPAQPSINMNEPISTADTSNSDVPVGLKTLPTTIHAAGGGDIARITLEANEIPDVEALDQELKKIAADIEKKELLYEQVLITVDPQLKYSELIKVIDVFTRNKLTKLSFAELTDAGA